MFRIFNSLNKIQLKQIFILLSVCFCSVLFLQACTSSADSDLNGGNGNGGLEGLIRVENGKLVDGDGGEFIPYGVNSIHVWRDAQHSLNALENEISKTEANSVRIVSAGKSWHWNNQSITANQKRNLVQAAINAGLVPMLEMHDGTCVTQCNMPPVGEDGEPNNRMGLRQIVDEWLEPENLQTLSLFEDKLLLNIANEWGDNNEEFFICYKDAITRLRDAGVKNVLVIDAGGNCGQNPNSLLQYGDDLFEHDPLQNLVLSIHLYGFWRTNDRQFTDWTPPFSVEVIFPQLADLKAPVLVGEFGWDPDQGHVNFNPKRMLEISKELGMGWYFWAWSDGEEYHNVVNTSDYTFNGPGDLTPAGEILVNDPDIGFKHIARPAAGF